MNLGSCHAKSLLPTHAFLVAICSSILLSRTDAQLPTFFIAIDARNNEPTLPFCLNEIFQFTYDRNLLSLLIVSSFEITAEWRDELSKRYHAVHWRVLPNLNGTADQFQYEEINSSSWNEETSSSLRFYQLALDEARRSWVDYLFVVRSLDFLAARNLLRTLVNVNSVATSKYWLIHPVLVSPLGHLERDGITSSISWQFVSSESTNVDQSILESIVSHDQPSCLPTAKVKTDWEHSDNPLLFTPYAIYMRDQAAVALRFYPPVVEQYSVEFPVDALCTTSLVCAACFERPRRVDLDCWRRALQRICLLVPQFNEPFGFYPDSGKEAETEENAALSKLEETMEHFRNFTISVFIRYGHKIESIVNQPALRHRPIRPTASLIDDVGRKVTERAADWKVLLINLQRRAVRRERSLFALQVAGLSERVEVVRAVDRLRLSGQGLARIGVRMLPDFVDLVTGRNRILFGETACFLSHYSVWQRVAFDAQLPFALVLEDDFVLERGFQRRFSRVLDALHAQFANGSWDLVYIGREPFYSHFGGREDEPLTQLPCKSEWCYSDVHFLRAGYSHYLNGYLLSKRGARKLIARQPLSKMVPVDQFVPLVAKSHVADDWFHYFEDVHIDDSENWRNICTAFSDFGGEPNCGINQLHTNWSLQSDDIYEEFETLTVDDLLIHPLEYIYSQPVSERSKDATDVEVLDRWLMPDPPFYSDVQYT